MGVRMSGWIEIGWELDEWMDGRLEPVEVGWKVA